MGFVKTNALRVAILVVLIGGGLFLIDRGFSGTGVEAAIVPSNSPAEPAPTGSTTPRPQASETTAPQAPSFVGITYQVNNATSEAGLAGRTSDDLLARYPGLIETDPDTVDSAAVTTIFYGTGALAQAEWIAADYFGSFGIQPAIEILDTTAAGATDVDIVIYLGTDFLNAQPA